MEAILTMYGGAILKGFFVTLFLLAVILFLQRWHIPSKKSAHHTPTKVSRFGGVALVAGFLLALMMSTIPTFPRSWWVVCAVLVGMLVVGVWDDIRPLHWSYQLMAQAGILVALYCGGVKILTLTNPEGGVFHFANSGTLLAAAGFFLFLAWGILVFNTINWLDGIDGLCASVMMVAYGTLFFLALSPVVYQPAIAILLAVALGVTGAFLIYNYPPAKIMGGTSGSLFFGAVIIFVSVVAGTKIATTLLVLALPITDTFFVLVKRLLHKRSLFAPDRGHLHHILQRLGWQNRSIVIFYTLLTLGISGIALSTQALGKLAALILIFGVLGIVLAYFHFQEVLKSKATLVGGMALSLVLIVGLVVSFAPKLPAPQNAFIHGHWYALAVADTPEERAAGLSGQQALCLHCGMLFVFPEPTEALFWMKDMQFSLDVLWLVDDRVVAKHENLPFPSLETFGPNQPITKVIEVPAGAAHGIPLGAKVYFW